MNHVDGAVGIHFRDINKSNPNTYGNNVLHKELGKLGIGTYVVPNSDAYNLADKTAVVRPVLEDSDKLWLEAPQEIELTESGLSVVRARVHTPRQLEDIIPVINGPKLRDIGASKWQQYELAADYMPGTVALEDGQSFVPELIDELRGETIVVKADQSKDSEYLAIGSRGEAVEMVEAMRAKFAAKEAETGKPAANKRILLQEFVPGKHWPGLEATDDMSRSYMAMAKSLELRVYSFVDLDRERSLADEHYVTARSVFNGTDEWIYVDQATVPQEAWNVAHDVSVKLLEKAGVRAGYFAVDLVRGQEPGTDHDRTYVREINTRDPMMVEMHHNQAEAVAQRRLLAGMLASVVRRGL